LVFVVGAVQVSMALPVVGVGLEPEPDPDAPELEPGELEDDGEEVVGLDVEEAELAGEELELEPPPQPERTSATTVKPQKAFKSFMDTSSPLRTARWCMRGWMQRASKRTAAAAELQVQAAYQEEKFLANSVS
jgi:hypothetical protein